MPHPISSTDLQNLIAQAVDEQWEELDLSGMELSELPKEIGRLTQLKRLFLGKWNQRNQTGVGNQLTTLPPELWQLQQLKKLDISNNQISKIPESIANLVNLTQLYLGENQITEIPDSMENLVNLTTLHLWQNQIGELPNLIINLTNLRVLSLVANQISEIPDSIAQLINLRVLDLGANQISEVPDSIAQLVNLRVLPIGDNQISKIPNSILNLINLRDLDLSRNKISEIPDSIENLVNLTKLSLYRNQLSEIPDSISQLANLKSLYIFENNIRRIPDSITNLVNLKTLHLSQNQITEIPDSIANLVNLKILNLSQNQITEIPDSIKNLASLKKLYVCYNQISEIPESIAQLVNLTGLYLWVNKIRIVPDSIGYLVNLTQLNLSQNEITQIPDSIIKLVKLTQLHLVTNKITEIPDSITNLVNLQDLNLSQNSITKIPDSIANLVNLTELSLNQNQISEIPSSINELVNLETLRLWGNQLKYIPNSITQLINLTQLTLDRNQIADIPDSIINLTKLILIGLGTNQIGTIPDCIMRLEKLSELYLWDNQITEIPDSIAQLSNLTILNLDSNQITSIPEAIAKLHNLTRLNLRNNQITATLDELEKLENLTTLDDLDLRWNIIPLSPEMLESAAAQFEPQTANSRKRIPGNPSEIFNYIKKIRSGDVRPLNEAKVLLVGQGSVGKTSLINRLIDNTYNPTEPQTDGLNVTTWHQTINTKDIRLNIWDFGGQEIYHATHQFFLTKRSLYLLVANCRTSEDENRLDYWLQLIQTFGDSAPVILIGNKCDEQPLDLNRKALQEKYPNIKAILETSCETEQGIPELRTLIHQEIANLREVYDLLPQSWFNLKQTLETLDQDFISLERYITLCAQNGITEETDQDQLIRLLHNLGIVLNFRDHPILQTTNILNPHWVTSGIYSLLSDPTLKTTGRGILTPADLDRILPTDRYPKTRHHCLLELMREFQLCFPLPDTQNLLIPALLPKEQPDNIDLPTDTLDFQYHYPILPDSILSRFIVLSHEKVHNNTYWRTGVLLEYCENGEPCNLARIQSDPADSKIFIRISGRDQTRRSFLALIRDTFTRIHRTFANLPIDEYVPVPGHPTAEPLDYQELLGLEEMGETTVKIGKLKLKLDLRPLLNGYESIEQRQIRRMGDRGDEFYRDEFYGKVYDDLVDITRRAVERPINNTAEVTTVSNDKIWTGDRVENKFAGDQVMGDKDTIAQGNKMKTGNVAGDAIAGNKIVNSQNLTQAAQEISALLNQISATDTTNNQTLIAMKAIEAIEKNPTLKERIINAGKEAGFAALDAAVEHPAVKIVTAAIKGAMV